jgi:capsular polysaccharide biosynthesis protein
LPKAESKLPLGCTSSRVELKMVIAVLIVIALAIGIAVFVKYLIDR